ncbi:MAG TPA: S1C family serine protease [Patescibacteria group bacterium]|nr:S1C family serine protease [Patescibacteria group bacterium]
MTKGNWIWIIILAFVLGAIGGVLLNRFGIPFISGIPGMSWVQKLESSNPVIINRVQQVELNEGANLIDLSKQAAGYTSDVYASTPDHKFLANGIIVTADGMIITPKSDLPAAGDVTVVTNDGTAYTGQIRAQDPRSDLAVVTISAQNLPFAQFADAGTLAASQQLIYLGRSNNSFTRDFALGRVNRSLDNNQSLSQILDSDAFENEILAQSNLSADFAGGPVIDLDGKVVGMTRSNLSVLISEDLHTAVDTYLRTGKITRPYLGMKYLDLSDAQAHLKNLPQGGVEVVSVAAGSAAQAAGLLPNDLITQASGQNISGGNFETILNQQSGDLSFTILRNGQNVNVTAKLIYK